MKNIKTIQIGNLLWEADPPDKRVTWDEAMAYAASLGAGFRLPAFNELQRMFDYDNTRAFGNGLLWQAYGYWSSTTYVPNTSYAWNVDFVNGYVYSEDKTTTFYVRCVRPADESSNKIYQLREKYTSIEVFTRAGIELLSDKVILETVFNTDDKQVIKDFAKAEYIGKYASALLSNDPESLQALISRLQSILRV